MLIKLHSYASRLIAYNIFIVPIYENLRPILKLFQKPFKSKKKAGRTVPAFLEFIKSLIIKLVIIRAFNLICFELNTFSISLITEVRPVVAG